MVFLYPYMLILHLICAIIFLGFIFTDVVLFSQVRKILGEDMADRMFDAILKRGRKIMPLCLITLILTGGIMISRYIGSEIGIFNTMIQKLLMLKVFFAFLIVMMVICSFYFHFSKKPKGKFMTWLNKNTHFFALFFGACIVVLAKMAFWL